LVLAHSTHTWLPLTEQWIYRQVSHINIEEQIILCDKKDDAFPEIVRTFYNPTSPFDFTNRIRNKLRLPDAFRNKILKQYDDVILFSHYGIRGYHDLGLKKQKHITRFYGYDLTRTLKADVRWKSRYEKLFDECNLFIVEGNHMKNVLHSLGCDEKKIKVSFLGVDLNEVNFKKRIENATLNVLIACATAERKGIIYSLRAIEKAINYYHVPIHIHWVGGRNSNYAAYIEYEKLLNDFISATNLKQHITYYGFLPPVGLQAVARKCQIAIHPSVWAADGDCEGGYPVVLVDLMATGLPIITTDHCDIPEVVNNDNGYVCPEKNIDALIAALVDTYESKSYIDKSILARQTVEKKFDWEKLGDQLTGIILNE
jgi:colanic acid/amylovoran biosynthesis glycosyltransferase